MNPLSMGCLWTGEFDLNTLLVDLEIFQSGKKNLWFQKYLDKGGRGIRRTYFVFSFLPEQYSACNGIEEETGTKKGNPEASYLPNTSQKATNIALTGKNQLVNLLVM